MSKMKTVLVEDGGYMFKRVDKHIARAAYKNNMALLICPKDKVPSLNPNNDTIKISKSRYSSDFDSIASFATYHYRKYIAYYVPVKSVTTNGTDEYDYSFH